MDSSHILEKQIEQLRSEMYRAYYENRSYEIILRISKELDTAMNKLAKIGQTKEK